MDIKKLLKNEIINLKKTIIAYICITVCTMILQLIVPYVSGIYIDSLVDKHSAIMVFVVAIAFLNIFSIMLEFGMTYFMTKLNNTFLYKLCNKIFQTIYKSSLTFFQNKDAAFLTDQITGDAATISGFLLNGLPDFTYNIILLVISALFVIKADILLGIIIIVTIPIYFVVYKKLENRMYQNEQEYKMAGNEYTAKGMEQIRCTRFVKENSVSKEMEDRFAISFRRMLKGAIGQVKIQYLFANINRLIMVFCYLMVLAIGGYNVISGKISIGYFTIITSYVNMILSAATDVIDFSGDYPKVRVALDRMNKVLAECYNCIEQNKGLTEDKLPIESINLEKVSFSYGEKVLFKNLSAKFEKGKIYGIVGENGVGKSTLLDVIVGLYPEKYTGNIYYDNKNIKTLNCEEVRKREIAFLSQQIERINISPKEYLHFGIENYDVIKEKKILELFSLDIDSNIIQEDNIIHCSGGEMQKLELVRNFQKNCTVKIMDEPTNGLDVETVKRLVHLLEKEKKDHIFIIVSHDKRVLNICDEKIVIECNSK
ncbi:ABC transporter ATP-binding protein [Anaerostipes hadrus]|uniref:ABC transporter ATP-binding protein n=1 Tax=Blautia parvula TaxID=2877527 RepID=A0ABQ0C0Q5_9FIRM